MMAIWNSSFNQ